MDRSGSAVYPVFANALVGDALEKGALDCLRPYQSYSAEVKHGSSRFDFCLTGNGGSRFVEVKSVSLVEDSVGKFPDAPTERGRKHVEELLQLKRQGVGAVVLFVSQRSDTRSITANDDIDPKFGEGLRQAKRAGVELYGYNCRVTPSSISLDTEVPVVL